MCCTGSAVAQSAPAKDTTFPKIVFGIKAGASLQSTNSDTWDKGYKPGFTGGIMVGMHKHKFGVRAEVLLNISRYKAVNNVTDSAGTLGDFRVFVIDVPVLLEYDITPRFTILAGPQYTDMLSVKTLNSFAADGTVIFKPQAFSGVVGIEAKLPKQLSIGARYAYGFTNINNGAVSTDTWQSSAIQVYAAYRIK